MPKHSLGLTLVQMRALVSVVEAGGFTGAAQRLHVQQPTVSAEIQRLEQRCGFELLERRGGTRLTKEGRRLYEEARAVLAAAEKWESVLLELQNSRRGRAQIGSGHTIGTYVLPRLVAQFRAVHPGIEVGLRTNNSAASLDALVTEGVQDAQLRLGNNFGREVTDCHLVTYSASLSEIVGLPGLKVFPRRFPRHSG
jgi:DNA-binding transcriptional LysR family regulator